jgi:hypothetical protein
MNEELRTELLARADRDQTARKSLPPALRAQCWDQVIAPVDRANTARMREIVARYACDAAPRDLAYLTDRVLMHRGEPQVYGTQYQVIHGEVSLWSVRDPDRLDQRRAALGLPPEAENRARLLAAERLTG